MKIKGVLAGKKTKSIREALSCFELYVYV